MSVILKERRMELLAFSHFRPMIVLVKKKRRQQTHTETQTADIQTDKRTARHTHTHNKRYTLVKYVLFSCSQLHRMRADVCVRACVCVCVCVFAEEKGDRRA